MRSIFLYFILFLIIGHSQILKASDQWYGTVHYKQIFSKDTKEDYPADSPLYPGYSFEKMKIATQGVVRYLPGSVVNHKVTHFQSQNFGSISESTITCSSGKRALRKNNDIIDSLTQVSVNRNYPDKMTIFIIDGKYSSMAFSQAGSHIQNANKLNRTRELFNGCDENPKTPDTKIEISSDGAPNLSFSISGDAQNSDSVISGNNTITDSDGTVTEYSWQFNRAAPQLIANISGSTTIERAQDITLDASKSIGTITDYEWEFVPEGDCLTTPEGSQVILKTPQVSFKALCDFRAYLKISNSTTFESDRAEFFVKVLPRKNNTWITQFKTKVGPNLDNNIVSNMMHFGVNQCAEHTDIETHFIHTDTPNTWRDSGYKIQQVNDSGLFKGAWYIESSNLNVNRSERVSKAFYPGSSFYELNKLNNNLPMMASLLKSTKIHESVHSQLLQEYLISLGEDNDPAAKIEKMVYPEDSLLETFADMAIRQVATDLAEATSEDHVKNRLYAKGLTNTIKVWMNDDTGNAVFKDLGPQWSVGE